MLYFFMKKRFLQPYAWDIHRVSPFWNDIIFIWSGTRCSLRF